MKVKIPIFIIGAGRSGSTVFHAILCEHPNISWLSRLCDKFPHKPSINQTLMKTIDYPMLGKLLRRLFKPSEPYRFWDYHFQGFSVPCRDLRREDVTIKCQAKIQSALSNMLTSQRYLLLVKITGWPRIGFFREIFDDAKFIHIVRDGRAVAHSLLNVDWWWGWRGPHNWRWGELTPYQQEEWERHDKSFIALAGIQWKILMDAMEQAKRVVNKEDFMEVKFEDLCSNPYKIVNDVVEFCGLEWKVEYENVIRKFQFRNTNDKWRRNFNVGQQKILEEVTRDYLERYGYL